MAKRYRLRTGVVSVTVCGETILVAGREARGKCPYTLHLSEASAYNMSLMEKGLSDSEMTAEAVAHYNIDAEAASKIIHEFIAMLSGYGYLVAEDCE